MSSERWERIKALHARAAELTGEAREAFLAEQCAGDAELRRRVEELLGNQVEDFFLQPPKASSVDSSEVQPDLTGRVLGGEYELLRLIGTGGSGGAVYVARQRSLDREVAIKILPVPAAVSPRHLERFRREANAAARLHHPGIVPIYGLGDLDGAPYYAMEFVPGGDLHDALQRLRDGEEGPVPAPRTEAGIATMVRLVAEVADALQLAHDAGIVHRDIKPQNLVIGAGGQLQIVDFGLARDESLGTITLPDEIQGTPHYMSPEQAHVSKQKVDHRTDVYSLGVVLYEMLTLRRPFEGRTSREIIDSIEHREARRVGRRNPSIPVDLETICHGAIDKDREARYPSARELAADLRRFLAGEPIRMRPPTLARRVRRFVQRNRGRSIAVAAGALALVAGIAGTSWRQHARAQEQLPHLSLRTEPADFFDAAGNRIVPEVWLRPLPLFDLLPGEKLALGSAPLDGVPVEPGTYRVVVHVEGVGSAELTRELEPGRDEDLLAYVRPTAEVTRGMVRFEEAELTFRNAPEERTGCGLDGETHELAAYWIEQHEVSFGEYRAFLADTGRARPALWKNWNTSLAADDLPVVGVSWEAARAYAEWAGKRLVTHAEWERAGRGLEGRRFPWVVAPGEEAALRGNLTAVDDGDHGGSSAGFANYLRNVRPVDSHPEARTPEGLYHMYGNVAEFTESKVIDRTGDGLEVQHEERTRLGNKWDAQSPERQEFFKMGFTEHDKIGAGRAGAIGDTGFRCAKSVGP